MKFKNLLIVCIVIGSISAITFLILSLNQTPYNSFYYGSIGLPENDKFCFITLTIHNSTITPAELVQNVRQGISKLGPQYDFGERKITAEQINMNTISIEIGGSWRTKDSSDHPNLLKLFSDIDGGTIDDRLLVTCA